MRNLPFETRDLRAYNPTAVGICQLLGSENPVDFLAADAWLKSREYTGSPLEVLAELFDIQVGLDGPKEP